MVREFSRAVRQKITSKRKASGILIRLLLIDCIHHFLPSKVVPGSSNCKPLIEDIQGKTDKMRKPPSITQNSFKKEKSVEFSLKSRESHSRGGKKGYSHNCISWIMLKSKGSADISHDETPVGNHKKHKGMDFL